MTSGSGMPPYLIPTSNSPIIAAKKPMPCPFLSKCWCAAERFLCLKGIPTGFSVEEGSDLAGEVLICNIGDYQHRANLYDQGKMDISQTSKQEFASILSAENIHLNEWTTAPMHRCSGKQTLCISKLDFSYNYGHNTNVQPLAL